MPTDDESSATNDADGTGPSDGEVVEIAADAAEDVVFSRLDGDVDDLDVTVSFADDVLAVDVFIHAPDASADEQQVADDAALAAQSAVDDLFS